MKQRIAWILGFFLLITIAAFAPDYFPEDNVPKSGDSDKRSLQKINDLLLDSSTYLLALTNAITSNVNVTNTLSVSVTNTPSVGITNYGTTYPLAIASYEWLRPADSDPYIAGDVINTSTSESALIPLYSVVDQAGKGGHITRVEWVTVQPTNTAAVRIHFYNIPTALVVQDNAAFTVALTNIDNYIGYVDVTTMNNVGAYAYGTAVSGESKLPFAFMCNANENNLYCLVETRNAFTPAISQTCLVRIYVQQ